MSELRPFRIQDHEQTCDGMHKGADGKWVHIPLGAIAWSPDEGETELYCLECYQEETPLWNQAHVCCREPLEQLGLDMVCIICRRSSR